LVGLPNAGKSTLSNRLLGQRYTIVTRKPNTTRKRVLGIRTDSKCQLVLLDTPGVVLAPATLLDARMMRSVTDAVRDADLVVLVVDAAPDKKPKETVHLLKPPSTQSAADRKGGKGAVPMCVVLNKTDLVHEDELKRIKEWVREETGLPEGAVVGTCGKTGEGVGQLLAWCREMAPLGPWMYPDDAISDQNERFFVAEIVREKLILQFEEELPYASHVTVVDFKERKKGKDYVAVEITVERESQKQIIIGRGGGALKKLATASRLDIEQFLMRPVYLKVHVKVNKDWRKTSQGLKDVGLEVTDQPSMQ